MSLEWIDDNNLNLRFLIPRVFKDKSWGDYFGDFQRLVQSRKEEGTIKALTFDFIDCVWIDPFPLASILLESLNAKHCGLTVTIVIPSVNKGTKYQSTDYYGNSPNRLLLFLINEGFIANIEDYKIDVIDEDGELKTVEQLSEDIKSVDIFPSFEESLFIPFTSLKVPDLDECPNFAAQAMAKLTEGIDRKLIERISSYELDKLTYKLRLAIQELLHNIQEHAFSNSDSNFAVVYARYRTGGLNLVAEHYSKFESDVKQERERANLLAIDWLHHREGCIELFVLDRGQGIVNSFAKSEYELKGKYKRPLLELLENSLYSGDSSKRTRTTQYGGLHLLHQICTLTRDRFRVLDDKTWVGTTIPNLRNTSNVHRDAKTRLKGLAWHFCFCWKSYSDNNHWLDLDNSHNHSRYLKILKTPFSALDKRFEDKDRFDVIDERFTDKVLSDFWKAQTICSERVLWFPKPNKMKWDILDSLEQIAKVNSKSKIKLIVADIPTHEAATYNAALESFSTTTNDSWPSSYKNITLVSTRFRFARFKYFEASSKHGFSNSTEDAASEQEFYQQKTLTLREIIVYWIKWHDSRLFWNLVSQKNGNGEFKDEIIEWKQGEIFIRGYLDFLHTTRNTACMKLYQIAIKRFLGVLRKYAPVEITVIDKFVEPVLKIEDFVEDSSSPEQVDVNEPLRVGIGSVLVTGETKRRFFGITEENIHFFCRPEAEGELRTPSLFFWEKPHELPSSEFLSTNREKFKKRIGSSPTIAFDGWKSIEIPRYDEDGNSIGFRTPTQTYHDLQSISPIILKTGHWSYEGKHDFITINLFRAIEDSYYRKSKLFKFLINNIFPHIGITSEQLKPEWRDAFLESNKNGSATIEKGLVVYRSHQTNELMVQLLSQVLLNPQQLYEAMIPLLPFKTKRNGSTFLTSPAITESLKTKIQTSNGSILILDDACISGKTLLDIESLVTSLGTTEVSSLVILNRQRMPASSKSLKYYWRIDLPQIGTVSNCPMCHTLRLLDSFSKSVVSNSALNEIKDWNLQWSSVSPITSWYRGIRPTTLAQKVEPKGFCWDSKIQDYRDKLDLFKSTAYALNISELHCMTGRDDYGIQKVSDLYEPEVRIEIAASQVFTFGSELSYQQLQQYAKIIFESLSMLPNRKISHNLSQSNYYGLAVLTFIYVLDLVLDEQRIEFLYSVIDFEKLALGNKDDSITILITYLHYLNLLKKKQIERFISELNMLSVASLPIEKKLRYLHANVLSVKGNSHSFPLSILIEKLNTGVDIESFDVCKAQDSLDKISDILKFIERPKANYVENVEYGVSVRKLEESINCVRAKLSNNIQYEDVVLIESLLKDIRIFASNFCFEIKDCNREVKKSSFVEYLKRLKDSIIWSSVQNVQEVFVPEIKILRSEISLAQNQKELWILWTGDIEQIVEDLLKNAIHSKEEVKLPCHKINTTANMWVEVSYLHSEILLRITSNAKDSAELAFKKMSMKNRWSELIGYGGKIERVKSLDVDSSHLCIDVSIPYINYI